MPLTCCFLKKKWTFWCIKKNNNNLLIISVTRKFLKSANFKSNCQQSHLFITQSSLHSCVSYLRVVLCVPGSQGDGLQVQFTSQIYSRYNVPDRRENKKKQKTVQSVAQKHAKFCGNNSHIFLHKKKLTLGHPESEISYSYLNLL